MVEVLVATLVFSIGLLGLAGLQVHGLRSNQSAYARSVAVQQGYDMAERIRANPAARVAGDYDQLSGLPPDPGCIDTGCTPAQLARTDLHQWNTDNAALLPSGTGTVTRKGDLFTITVMWDDARTGATGTDCSGDPSVDLNCLAFSFTP